MYLVVRTSNDTIPEPVVVSAKSKKDAIRKMKDNYNALKKEYENDDMFEVDATSFVNDNAAMLVVNAALSGNQYDVVSWSVSHLEMDFEEQNVSMEEEEESTKTYDCREEL